MTNPFIELDPPNDTTGRTPKMLAGYKTRGIDNGEPIPPNNSGSAGGYRHQFFNEWRNPADQGPHDDAEENVDCAAVIVDNSKGSYGTLQSHVITPGVGSAELAVKYSANLTTPSWADFGPAVPLVAADPDVPRVGARILLPDASRISQLLLKLVRRGGNGVITPAVWNAILVVEGGPARGGGSDLPEDAIWGSVVFDANAMGPQFTAIGLADDADLNFVPDETGLGHNLTSNATLLLPHYRTAAFSGGLPCFSWGGSSVPLYTNNPTEAYGDYTYYYVLDAMDGGDGALLWGHTGGDSFSYRLLFDDGNLYAANNNLFGTPTAPFAVDLSVPHLVRWSKNSASSHWKCFVDGVMLKDEANAPQTNNGGRVFLMDNLGGVGSVGLVGRVAAYNRAHESPTGEGVTADGLTAPELVLQDEWGIP